MIILLLPCKCCEQCSIIFLLKVLDLPNGRKSLKLADFGLAMEVKSPMFLVCGTPTYVAPEILDESGYAVFVT